MKNNPIFVTRPSMPSIEEYIEEIKPIFDAHILTNMGPVHQKFKEALTSYLGVRNVSLFVNGHMALEMAIQSLGLKELGEKLGGGEVITTPFTFVSTTHAITRNNLTPVFCDIRELDYTIDPDKIEALITEKTVAIIPVHVYGNICDVEKIGAIAKKYDLKVIYDAAHAFGVKYKGIGIGNYGDASMFSFHATKVFNSIEGGAITFSDDKYAEPLEELKNFGIHEKDSILNIGPNAKMNEFAAAMGICNLRHVDEEIEARRAVYDSYSEKLDGVEGITIIKMNGDSTPNYAYMPIRIDKNTFGKSRDEVYDFLGREEIYARKYFYPAVNEADCYVPLSNKDLVSTPIASKIASEVITLPMYAGLDEDSVNRICDVILG